MVYILIFWGTITYIKPQVKPIKKYIYNPALNYENGTILSCLKNYWLSALICIIITEDNIYEAKIIKIF